MAWFNLTGDARLGRCATEDCGGAPTYRLEADGVGSNYCSGCHNKILLTEFETLRAALAASEAREKELRKKLQNLANAADDVGVRFFDTDTMEPEVEAMQQATIEARAILNPGEKR